VDDVDAVEVADGQARALDLARQPLPAPFGLHTVPGADCAGAHSSKTLASGTATLLT
jgi:hypothetical protein